MLTNVKTTEAERYFDITNKEDQPEIEVAIEANILSVNDLDDTFRVALLIHTLFPDPLVQRNAVEGKALDVFALADSYHGFHPNITIVNTTYSQFSDWQRVYRINEFTGEVWIANSNTFTISESLEFAKFPFDRQLFRVRLKSNNARLRPWRHDPTILKFTFPGSNSKDDVYADQMKEDLETATYLVTGVIKYWSISGIIVSYNPEKSDTVSLNEAAFSLGIKAERKPDFYFYNHVFVVYIICAANLVTIAVDPDFIVARNGVTVTLLLTLITFKYIVIGDTPRVNYQTYMDRYLRLAFIQLIFAGLVNIVYSTRFLCHCIGLTTKDDCTAQTLFARFKVSVDRMDFYTQIGLFLAWSTLHIVIWIVVLRPSFVTTTWKTIYAGERKYVQGSIHKTRNVFNEFTKKKEQVKIIERKPRWRPAIKQGLGVIKAQKRKEEKPKSN